MAEEGQAEGPRGEDLKVQAETIVLAVRRRAETRDYFFLWVALRPR